jgi:type III pantothenate kinase
MTLALDAGNTTITAGLFARGEILAHGRIPTRQVSFTKDLAARIAALFPGMRPDAVAVCTVAPPMEPMLRQYAETAAQRVTFVASASDVPMPVRYDPPSSLGADRLVNAFAAFRLFGGPCIVVDLGTATKLDVVDADGVYQGGAIAPGAGVSARALTHAAPRLPHIDICAPPAAIGHTTRNALSSGLVFGHAAMIDGLVRRFRRELGEDALVISTGGLAALICAETETARRVEPFLTLRGLAILAEGEGEGEGDRGPEPGFRIPNPGGGPSGE